LIENLTFDEETHKYTFEGIEIPSVTQIITETHNALDNIPTSILENASERGKAVHQAIEFYNKYKFANIDEEHKLYFEAYKKWKNENEKMIAQIESEIKVFHKIQYYAGTADMLITTADNQKIIVDIKTTANLDLNYVALQLSAYKEALESQNIKIDKLYVLWLKKDGTYEYREVPNKKNIFMYALLLHNFWKGEL
jgi:K+/H+ antiporter YhaU regulatory subunit KhtT